MMNARTISLLIAFAATVVSGGAAAAGDAVKGAEKAKAVCAACHGDDGNGKSEFPDYPKLAGQHADYIAHALKEYKTGKRKNAIMAPMAQPLSPKDIEDIAAYFSKQNGTLKVVR